MSAQNSTSKSRSIDPRAKALRQLQRRIGYDFEDLDLLDRALSHSSLGNEGLPNYERLEFLGDSILGFLVAEHLYERFPDTPVGELTERRASLVSRGPLAKVAEELQLHRYLTVGKGLPTDAGHSKRILCDLVEAVLAAIYLDGGHRNGMKAARKFVRRHILDRFQEEILASRPRIDAKTRLNQLAQAESFGAPVYEVIAAHGPDHSPRFRVAVHVGGVRAESDDARSKILAEQDAAAKALRELRDREDSKDQEPLSD